MSKKALFEAWLRDGVCVERSDGSLDVFSREEGKAKIMKLINSGEYKKTAAIAKQLSNPIKLTAEKKRKSVRVPLLTYIKLVEGALRRDISLDGYVSNIVTESLVKTVSELKKRDDVKQDRIEFLGSCLLGENIPTSGEVSWKDILYSYGSRNGYYLSIEMPDNWEDIAKEVMEEARKSFIKDHGNEVDPEILQRYLELTYEEDLVYQNLDDTRPKISLKNGKLYFTFGMESLPYVVNETLRDKIEEEFGYDAVTAIEKSIGGWAFEDGSGPSGYEEFLEAEIEVTNDGELIIMGVQVSGEDTELKNVRQIISKIYDDEIAKIREDISTHLQNEEFERVVELSEYLEWLSNKKKRTNFAIDLLALLLKTTQVVTFSLPECLLYTLDAYGEPDLFKFIHK